MPFPIPFLDGVFLELAFGMNPGFFRRDLSRPEECPVRQTQKNWTQKRGIVY